MENILITGGAGFIGSHLTLKLIELGYHVTVLDNLSPQIHSQNSEDSYLFQSIKNRVKFIEGDVCNYSDWQKAIVGNEVIVHLAAETGTGQSMYQIDKYVEVNCGGTAKMLDVLANSSHTIRKVIVASSRAIYGEGKYFCKTHKMVYPEDRLEKNMSEGNFEPLCPYCHQSVELKPTDENSKIHPSSIYGITKGNQEQMVLVACESLGISALALRYQNVYGPGQSLSNPYTGILSIFSTRILNQNSLNVFEDGQESRDFVFISDVVDATILGIQSSIEKNMAINIGSGVSTTVEEIAQQLIQHYQSKVSYEINSNYRLGDIRHNKADITIAKKLLGYNPKISLDIGLKLFVEWVKNQKIETDLYDLSIQEMKQKGLMK